MRRKFPKNLKEPIITYDQYTQALKTVIEYKKQIEGHHWYLQEELTPNIYLNDNTKIGDIEDELSTRALKLLNGLTEKHRVFENYGTYKNISIKDLATVGYVRFEKMSGFGWNTLKQFGNLCSSAGCGKQFYRGSNQL